jgi:hypothetical protein
MSGSKRNDDNTYLYLFLGVAFLVATALIITTAGTPAAGIGFVIAAAACLGLGVSGLAKQRRSLSSPVDRERELLSAIRDNDGSITPAEAAMETSLTVREADALLSELAGQGHLIVKSGDGALYYTLPSRRKPELE